MIRTFVAALTLALVPVTTFAQTEDDAGDVSEVDKDRVGPLRERVRPVSGHLFRKAGRFEFSPSATASFNDPFFWKFLAGVTIGYFPTENIGVNLRLGMDAPSLAMGQMVISPAAQICTVGNDGSGFVRTCRSPEWGEIDGIAPGQLTFLGGIDGQYAPIYGKVGLVAETFLHFDLYAIGGVAAVGYKGPSEGVSGSVPMITPGLNLGVGARFVTSKWFAIRTEFRDLLYVEKTRTAAGSSLRSQFLFELGFSLFFPTGFARE
jgi:outer membrane beta-barrel protein